MSKTIRNIYSIGLIILALLLLAYAIVNIVWFNRAARGTLNNSEARALFWVSIVAVIIICIILLMAIFVIFYKVRCEDYAVACQFYDFNQDIME